MGQPLPFKSWVGVSVCVCVCERNYTRLHEHHTGIFQLLMPRAWGYRVQAQGARLWTWGEILPCCELFAERSAHKTTIIKCFLQRIKLA